MSSNLKSRLARLRKERLAQAGSPVSDPGPGSVERPAFLRDWEELCPLVYGRTLSRPLAFPPDLDPSPFLPTPPQEPRLDSRRLRFFDLETTGLSGGSGTLAFLASVGSLVDGALVQRQFFLADYPGEGPFLEALLGALQIEEGAVLASYNGRSFDSPLLRTRCVLNGLSLPPSPHLDLLYPARRLWKRIHGGAGLGLLELAVLGRERGPDLPSSLIPSLYFAFLREGESTSMAEVVSHNAEDVYSLAALFARFFTILSRPLEWRLKEDLDRTGLGLILVRTGREGEGEVLLREAARAGDEVAGIALMRLLSRQGRDPGKEACLELLGSGPKSEVERAKYLEHRSKDWAGALEATKRALNRLGEARIQEAPAGAQRLASALGVRKERLEGKLRRQESSPEKPA